MIGSCRHGDSCGSCVGWNGVVFDCRRIGDCAIFGIRGGLWKVIGGDLDVVYEVVAKVYCCGETSGALGDIVDQEADVVCARPDIDYPSEQTRFSLAVEDVS